MPVSPALKELMKALQEVKKPSEEATIELVKKLKTFIESGGDVNEADEDDKNVTLLHLAALYGHKEVVKTLLEQSKINVDAAETNGLTPLHYAAQEGKIDVVNALLARRTIDVNARKSDGLTPLHLAAAFGHQEVVSALIADERVDVNAGNECGRSTPLHLAAYKGHKEVVKVLLTNSWVIVDAAQGDGETPLHRAAYKGRADVVDTLIEAGAKVGKARTDGATPLHIAVNEGHAEIVAKLLMVPTIDVFQGGFMVPVLSVLWEAFREATPVELAMNRGLFVLSLVVGKIESLVDRPPFQYPIIQQDDPMQIATTPEVLELLRVIAPRASEDEVSERVSKLRNLRGELLQTFKAGGNSDLATTLKANVVIATLLEGKNLDLVDKFRVDTAELSAKRVLTSELWSAIASYNFPIKFPCLKQEEQNDAQRIIINSSNLLRQSPVAAGVAAAAAPSPSVGGAGAAPISGGAYAGVAAGSAR